MKPALLIPLLLVAGLGLGGGAAYGVHRLLPSTETAPAKPEPEATSFTPTGKILAPLVLADGRLSGYVTFEVQLETSEAEVEFVTARMPMLLNAINMRTFRTPMAAGPDGMLPDLERFRRVVVASATEAFGPGIVKRAVITQATPA